MYLFFYVLKIQFYISGLDQMKYPILLLGIGLLTLHISLTTKIISFKKFFSMIMIFLPLSLDLLSGSYSFPFLVIFLSYVFFCCTKKKIFISPFIILIILFNFVHLGKYEFRDITWKNNFNEKEQSKLFVFLDVYKNIILDSKYRFKKIVDCSTQDYNCSYKNDYRLEQRIFHSFDSLLFVTKFTKMMQILIKN